MTILYLEDLKDRTNSKKVLNSLIKECKEYIDWLNSYEFELNRARFFDYQYKHLYRDFDHFKQSEMDKARGYIKEHEIALRFLNFNINLN